MKVHEFHPQLKHGAIQSCTSDPNLHKETFDQISDSDQEEMRFLAEENIRIAIKLNCQNQNLNNELENEQHQQLPLFRRLNNNHEIGDDPNFNYQVN